MSRRFPVMSMVAPLLPLALLGCSVLPSAPSARQARFLGAATPPIPPLPVYGTAPNQPYRTNAFFSNPPRQSNFEQTGRAVIGDRREFFGRPLSALHATLPVPSLVEITNLDNECSIIVRIVGRGAESYDRVIEISSASAQLLRIRQRGDVQVKYLGPVSRIAADTMEQAHLARFPNLGCTR